MYSEWWYHKGWMSDTVVVNPGRGYWPKLYQLYTWHNDFLKASWVLKWLSHRSYIIFRNFSYVSFLVCMIKRGGTHCQHVCRMKELSDGVEVSPYKPTTATNATDMASCHWSICWLLLLCITSYIELCNMDVQDLSALMSTLALSGHSPIGFVQKQMGTVTDSCVWGLRSMLAIFNITHLSGSLDSDPS